MYFLTALHECANKINYIDVIFLPEVKILETIKQISGLLAGKKKKLKKFVPTALNLLHFPKTHSWILSLNTLTY